VHALVGDLDQPAANMGVGGRDIELQPGCLEAGGERRDEGFLEVAVEAFDLALGLGSVTCLPLSAH